MKVRRHDIINIITAFVFITSWIISWLAGWLSSRGNLYFLLSLQFGWIAGLNSKRRWLWLIPGVVFLILSRQDDIGIFILAASYYIAYFIKRLVKESFAHPQDSSSFPQDASPYNNDASED